MRGAWIVREGRASLLLLFNGWGMDRRLADWMRSAWPDSGTHDLVVLYDYRDLLLPEGLAGEMEPYGAVDLVAWSLGVWAALNAGLDGIRRAVALNGTPFPIDGERGIPPATFTGTLDNWCDATRSRFERRMFSGVERDSRLGEVRSCRASNDQQEELRAIAGAVTASAPSPAPSWRFSKAVVGGRDLVFLPGSQLEAWHGLETEVVADMPHFPFFHLEGWSEVLA
ncbi:MAG: DUF452 family protein [Chlorobiaceae bacterium]|nr:DUF452 family protein [Chlorobiaceae bacterium]